MIAYCRLQNEPVGNWQFVHVNVRKILNPYRMFELSDCFLVCYFSSSGCLLQHDWFDDGSKTFPVNPNIVYFLEDMAYLAWSTWIKTKRK